MGKIYKRKPGTDRKPLVSVIIPTYNEEKVLTRVLQSIKEQNHKYIEIIVVDDGSNDNTVSLAESAGVIMFQRQHAERSIQRNFGVGKSKGEYVLILDADMQLTSSVVSECVNLMSKDKNIGAIVIPEKSVASNFWENVKAFERSFYNIEGDEITDAARFFKKEVFVKAGGYDETITGPEDWDLPETVKKLGYKIVRIKSRIYHYERINSPFGVARKKYYYALKSHRYLSKQHISSISPKTIFFLRPVFYKNWKIEIAHPLMSLAMFTMLALELIYGGIGFLQGKILNK